MGKLIDLTSRLKTVNNDTHNDTIDTLAQVLSYSDQKKKLLFKERRQVKRTVLTEFVSAMVVLPEKGLLKVDVYDISEDGISFDVDASQGSFQIDEIISIRIYLNHKTYFPMTLQVKHITDEPTEGVIRHGTEFLRGGANKTTTTSPNVISMLAGEGPSLSTSSLSTSSMDAASMDAALQYFIRFIEMAGSQLRKDNGDLMAPKIS